MPQQLIGIDGLRCKLLSQLIYRALHTARLNTGHAFEISMQIKLVKLCIWEQLQMYF